MGNILRKTTENVCLVALLVQFLSHLDLAVSQTEDQGQDTQNCTGGYLFTGTSDIDGTTLSSVRAYEEDAQGSFTIPNASLPANVSSTRSFLRVTNGQRSIDIIPQIGGVRLVPVSSIHTPPLNNTDESVFKESPVDCTFTGFQDVSDVIRDTVLGFCVGTTVESDTIHTYFYPLRIGIAFSNLSNSKILQNGREQLYGVHSNFVYVRNRCLPDEYGHVVFLDDNVIVVFNVESGTVDLSEFRTCHHESRLELISQYKVAAFCDGETTLITVCPLEDQTRFPKEEFGQVYFCSKTVFVSVKNSTLTLRSVSNREQIGNSTEFSSNYITYAVCNVNNSVYHFVATLDNGETMYCNLSGNNCELLGRSEHAVSVPSLFVSGQYVILNDGTNTILYDIYCQANPIVAQLSRNFDFANFYSEQFSVLCECTLPIATTTPETTTMEPTTSEKPTTTEMEPTTTHQPTTQASPETDRPTSSTATPSVIPMGSTSMEAGVIAAVVVSVITALSVIGILVVFLIWGIKKLITDKYYVSRENHTELQPLRSDRGSAHDTPEPQESLAVDPKLQPVVGKQQQPLVNPQKPVADPQQPLVDPQQPLVDPQQPVADPQQPLGDSQQPVADPQQPVADPQQPVADPQQPLADPQQPLADPQQPLGDSQQPVADPQQPVADPQQPVADPQQPLADPQQPLADPQQPLANPQQPLADPQQPLVNPQQPLVNPQQPLADPQQPLVNPQQPVANPQQPVIPIMAVIRPTLPLPLTQLNSNQSQLSPGHGSASLVEAMFPTDHDPLRASMVVTSGSRPVDPYAIMELEDQTDPDRIYTHQRVMAERNNQEQSYSPADEHRRNNEQDPNNEYPDNDRTTTG